MAYSAYSYADTDPRDQYILSVINNYAMDTSPTSPVIGAARLLVPTITTWANGQLLAIEISGSFAKGTGVKTSTDIDLFISLAPNTSETLEEIFNKLYRYCSSAGFTVKKQNVSIGLSFSGLSIDLVPGKKRPGMTNDHSLYKNKADTWTQTNIKKQIGYIKAFNRNEEIKALKIWRNLWGLDFPSFYLELTVINALYQSQGTLAENVWKVLHYLKDRFMDAVVIDPANTNNFVSEDLTSAEKKKIADAAAICCKATDWKQIIW